MKNSVVRPSSRPRTGSRRDPRAGGRCCSARRACGGAPWRRGCPDLSREPLGITGEALWLVEPLALPEGDASPGEIESSSAVRLLRDRAGAVRKDLAVPYQLDGRTLSAMVRVCRALDGMPLAIELAAARLRTMSLEQLASRLDDRFRLLTSGSRTALPRHRTLRAVIDWSWELLTDAERMVLPGSRYSPAGRAWKRPSGSARAMRSSRAGARVAHRTGREIAAPHRGRQRTLSVPTFLLTDSSPLLPPARPSAPVPDHTAQSTDSHTAHSSSSRPPAVPSLNVLLSREPLSCTSSLSCSRHSDCNLQFLSLLSTTAAGTISTSSVATRRPSSVQSCSAVLRRSSLHRAAFTMPLASGRDPGEARSVRPGVSPPDRARSPPSRREDPPGRNRPGGPVI